MKNKITNEQFIEALAAISIEAKSSIDPKADYITTIQEQNGKINWSISHHGFGGCTLGWGSTYQEAISDLAKTIGTPALRIAELRRQAEAALARAVALESETSATAQ
jgi:hypothetical protein